MSKELIMWITIGVYVVVMSVFGIVSNRRSKTMDDFAVGGRNAGAIVSAFSYGTAYFSAVMFIGYAGGSGWKYGIWSVLPGIGNAIIGALLAWFVLARRTREVTKRLDIKSMPQFFEQRYRSSAMKMFCVAVIFIFLLPYSASVYKGLTSVCSVLLGINEQVCMIVIALASAILVVAGGYLATLKADFLQGMIMMVGVTLLLIFVIRCHTVGGLTAGVAAITSKTKELGLGMDVKSQLGLWATVLMTSFGTWGLPQMIHKYYGIRDDREVKIGTWASFAFSLLIAGGGYFIGSLSHLFYTSLDQVSGSADYLVPNMLNDAGLPTVLLGVVLVLLISASVSTLASVTITASTTLTMDFLQPKIFKKMGDAGTASMSKLVCLIFVIVSYFIANTKTPILDMMSYSWGIISGSFLAPYAVSLYWKKVNKAGAWAGMIGGFITAAPPVICKLFFPDAMCGSFDKFANLGPHFACLAMLVSLLLVFVVSAIANAAGWKSAAPNPAFYDREVKTAD